MTLLCSAPTVLFSQLPAYLPADGLVGWWPFNGNANDESGNGNHGTVNGATLTAYRNGNVNGAYSFDGVISHIDVTNTFYDNSLNSFTLSIWAKPNVIGGTLINTIPHDGMGFGCTSFALNSNPEYHLWDIINPGSIEAQFYNPIQEDNWNLVSIVRENNIIRYFINGQEDRVSDISNSPTSVMYNCSMRFGNIAPGWYPEPFNGILDDISIYNRALTPNEILALYLAQDIPTAVYGCMDELACNYNSTATISNGSCTYPAQTYLNCDGTCINDTDADGVCNELEVTLPNHVPSNSLVAWYPFNGNAHDESGNGNHGVINGATLTTDRNGNGNSAYSFNGIDNSIVSTPNLPTGNTARTISLWTKTNSSSSSLMSAAAYGSGAGGYVIFPAFILNSNGKYYFESGSSSNQLFSESNVCDNTWHQITLTYSGLNTPVQMYVDGILNATSVNLDLITESSPFVIGSASWANLWFTGSIDDIAIYNRALTQEEITALYTGTSSNNNGGGGTAGTPAESVPAGIPYQAVIRDNSGAALVNAPVSVRFTLHQNTTDGTVEYQETQSLTTNAIGLINTQFGSGTATQGTFANINWSNTTKFIQVEANTGAGYVDMGTQQMMSVPFAMQSNKSVESTKVKNASLPIYANNAAALAGGLVAGEMYRTATGDLKIVY